MIITLGETTVDLVVSSHRAVDTNDGIPPAALNRLSPFLGGKGRYDLSLKIRLVEDLPWNAMLTREDYRKVLSNVQIIKERFPFTTPPFIDDKKAGKGDELPATGAVEKISLPILSRCNAGHITIIPHRGFLAALAHDHGCAEALVKTKTEDDLADGIVNVLMGVLSVSSPAHDGIMFHAGSLSIGGDGYLFVGSSGAGKSTIAAAAPPNAVLSDDGSWCIESDGKFYLYPTPFSRMDVGTNGNSPILLKRVMFLKKDSRDYSVGLSAGAAATMLLSNHIHFFRYVNNEDARIVFYRVARLCKTVDVSWLHFRRDFTPVPFFKEGV